MRILVTGAGGFIGGHLAAYLLEQGHEVMGLDIKPHEFRDDWHYDFYLMDLREFTRFQTTDFDRVYHLAANMGGMGWIHGAELDVMADNMRINQNIIEWAVDHTDRLFFSSSVCVYPDMNPGDPPMKESDVYPALPDNEYGWEKLIAERLFMNYARHTDLDVRIARFQNCYGQLGTWQGGREKAPAAIARKIATAENPGIIDIWGDGEQVRNFIHVSDIVRAIETLMESDIETPVNIGTEEYVTINQLAEIAAEVAGKKIIRKHIDGPVGVRSRNFDHALIRSLGWQPEIDLREGMRQTYEWIDKQVKENKHGTENA